MIKTEGFFVCLMVTFRGHCSNDENFYCLLAWRWVSRAAWDTDHIYCNCRKWEIKWKVDRCPEKWLLGTAQECSLHVNFSASGSILGVPTSELSANYQVWREGSTSRLLLVHHLALQGKARTFQAYCVGFGGCFCCCFFPQQAIAWEDEVGKRQYWSDRLLGNLVHGNFVELRVNGALAL